MSCSTSGMTRGPIISDVTDITNTGMTLQMQPVDNRYNTHLDSLYVSHLHLHNWNVQLLYFVLYKHQIGANVLV